MSASGLRSAPPSSFDAQPLLHLLGASKPDAVDTILTDAFRLRSSFLPPSTSSQWQSLLSRPASDIPALFASLTALLSIATFRSSITTKASLAALFPAGFHPALLSLLSKLILAHLPAWRASAASSLPSPPLLHSFSTSVHTRVSSSSLAHLNTPTIFLSLSLQPPRTSLLEPSPPIETLTCELKQEALKTLLSGLERIQEQLAGMQ